MPQKILEIKGDDWRKGLSLQTKAMVSGIFQRAHGFNPFELANYFYPSLSATELTAPADSIKTLVSYQSGGVGYFLAQTNTKLYQYLRASPYTRVDLSSKITVGTVKGAIWYKDRYVYATEDGGLGTVRASDLSASDLEIVAGVNTTTVDRPMCVGADNSLYIGNGNAVSKVVSVAGTAGNTLEIFTLESGMKVRELINDGRYLVILADNNVTIPANRVAGEFRCRVYFWDMSKATADVIWDIPDESYLIGGKFVNGVIQILAYNGLYECTIANPPSLIMDQNTNASITAKPVNSFQITASKSSIYWADGGATGQNIYAYGKMPGQQGKIFYTPFISHTSSYAHTAIAYSAGALIAAVDAPKLYIHNVGSTRGNGTIITAPIVLDQPYGFVSAKVVLRSPLSSGQSIAFIAANANDTVISDTETKSYSASNTRKNLLFNLTPASGSTSRFEDFYFTLTSVGGATVERVTIYANPSDDLDQTL
jgi:hypothetical protein